uniref:Uncharacterized protein n=1 Tax=Pipistrellus kuhlii TaxID=59472 RepID=A0A7J7UG47_PIPKU|nr:hypothetical protein mPipKuh1_009106 [Pipistrellus kuhlii]
MAPALASRSPRPRTSLGAEQAGEEEEESSGTSSATCPASMVRSAEPLVSGHLSPQHRRLDTLTSSFPGASEPGVSPGHAEPLHPSGASTLCRRPTSEDGGDVCGRLRDRLQMTGWEAGSGGRRSWCSQRIPDPQGSAALGLPRPLPPPGGGGGRGQDCDPGSPLASA